MQIAHATGCDVGDCLESPQSVSATGCFRNKLSTSNTGYALPLPVANLLAIFKRPAGIRLFTDSHPQQTCPLPA